MTKQLRKISLLVHFHFQKLCIVQRDLAIILGINTVCVARILAFGRLNKNLFLPKFCYWLVTNDSYTNLNAGLNNSWYTERELSYFLQIWFFDTAEKCENWTKRELGWKGSIDGKKTVSSTWIISNESLPSSCGVQFSIHWVLKGCESNSQLGTKIVNRWAFLSCTNLVPGIH